jgi:hypothetical protein
MRWTTGALIGAAVLVFAAGCGTTPSDQGQGTPSGTPGVASPPAPGSASPVPNGPNVQQALDTANREFKLLADGNWAGAWGLWTDTAKKEVTQKDFEQVNKTCPAHRGVQIQLQDVRPVSMELVELTWRRGESVGHSSLRLSGGKWLYEPGGETLAEYASGADAAIAKRRADNNARRRSGHRSRTSSPIKGKSTRSEIERRA